MNNLKSHLGGSQRKSKNSLRETRKTKKTTKKHNPKDLLKSYETKSRVIVSHRFPFILPPNNLPTDLNILEHTSKTPPNNFQIPPQTHEKTDKT